MVYQIHPIVKCGVQTHDCLYNTKLACHCTVRYKMVRGEVIIVPFCVKRPDRNIADSYNHEHNSSKEKQKENKATFIFMIYTSIKLPNIYVCLNQLCKK